MTEPIALTDGNIAMLEGPARALAAVGLDPAVGGQATACRTYLVERAGMTEELAMRVLVALRRLAAADA